MSETSKRRFPARLSPLPRPALMGEAALTRVTPKSAVRSVSNATHFEAPAARAKMVARIAAEGIGDAAVLAALGSVERHRFVETAFATQAYEDTSLPIGHGQTISKPSVVARMLELLNQCPLVKGGRVLEIGTGCAYQATLLGAIAKEVYTIERIAPLHILARKNISPLRLKNVHLILADGTLGYPQGAPFAGIISAAGGLDIPQTWFDQLAVGGRLVAPVHTSAQQQAIMVVDRTQSGLTKKLYEGVHFVPLQVGVMR